MAATRFGLLDLDVDLEERSGKKKENKGKAKPEDKNKKVQNKNPTAKKKKPASDSLHAKAFGLSKNKGKKKVNKPAEGPKEATVPKVNGDAGTIDDDDWNRRDNEFVQTENERCLREALMLSKLDYDEKEKCIAQMKKEDEGKGGKVKKKKDKPVTMSLEQFNNLRLDQVQVKAEPDVPEPRIESDTKFFDNIDKATQKTLDREAKHETYKATAGQMNQAMKAAAYEADIEKRDFEIQALRLEVDSLKRDLLSVKTRNKKLCEVFCSAEMKAKAELVVELDKMTKVREELTQEVATLSAQLEQERSKVNQLTLESKKQGKKK